MGVTNKEMEIFLPLPVIRFVNFFDQSFPIWSDDLKMVQIQYVWITFDVHQMTVIDLFYNLLHTFFLVRQSAASIYRNIVG